MTLFLEKHKKVSVCFLSLNYPNNAILLNLSVDFRLIIYNEKIDIMFFTAFGQSILKNIYPRFHKQPLAYGLR